MRILITGGSGYVARSLNQMLKSTYDVTTISRTNFSLSNSIALSKFFQSRKPFDVVIHCAVAGGSRLREDDHNVLDTNLSMYYNLLANKQYYKKFIHFGSGAELYAKDTPYGLSKSVISESILTKDDFYNLRIFGVFDENELDTRFIKASIKRYLKKEPIQVYQDRYMDFIYMPDLVRVVVHYINNTPSKEVDCCYKECNSLSSIANYINTLGDYKVGVKVGEGVFDNYIGKSPCQLPIEFIGLKQGIVNTYNRLKNEAN